MAYAMLEIAGINQRDMTLIHFASSSNFHTDLFQHGKYTKADVLKSAEIFLNGGTNYETPLREALRLMEENGYRKADVLFITDGECHLPETFADTLRETKAAMGFTITGVLMDSESPGMAFSLTPFCDEIIRISQVGGERAADLLVGNRA